MKLNALPSKEALLEKVDVLCVPSSKEKAAFLYDDVLAQIVHADALPPLAELLAMKSNPSIFFGQWNGHRIKVVFWCEGDKMTEASAYSLSKKMAIKVRSDCPGTTGLMIHHLDNAQVVQSTFAGWTAGQYDIGLYKQADSPVHKNINGEIFTYLPSSINEAVAKDGITIGLVQQEVMSLVNTPANHQSPASLGAWASRSAAQYGYTADILDKQHLITLGMHALLAVNRGSEQPAQCIVTHYKHPEATQKIALIGKGVIFDTGGISIKDSKNMHYMKSDMAGAAAALGTVEACARLKLKVEVIAIAPTTDNSIDGLAIKPGDVISSYAGKTIEVIDTDAEGRLILADALAYAVKEYKPDVMIDMATLTGSIVGALGPQAAGLFSKNDQLAASLSASGDQTGERVWRMPMYDEYHDDMLSDIADIKNLSEKAYAGSITAAKFLEFFTSEHTSWAHLDIAGMSFQPNGFGKGYCATGYGVRLLIRWLSLHAT
ncbi:MAG: leucyl aminopeptidase family protein [Saprospiraceae bacterium]|nr:leucyl aminopeptidase family protein [Saprospiraceae bacterium]